MLKRMVAMKSYVIGKLLKVCVPVTTRHPNSEPQ